MTYFYIPTDQGTLMKVNSVTRDDNGQITDVFANMMYGPKPLDNVTLDELQARFPQRVVIQSDSDDSRTAYREALVELIWNGCDEYVLLEDAKGNPDLDISGATLYKQNESFDAFEAICIGSTNQALYLSDDVRWNGIFIVDGHYYREAL